MAGHETRCRPPGVAFTPVARTQTLYVCRACGGEALKWQGQCAHCKDWDSLEAVTAVRGRASAPASRPPRGRVGLRRGDADGGAQPRLSLRHGGAGPGVRRRAGSRFGDAAGRRAGHRQIDSAAAGGGRAGCRTAPSSMPAARNRWRRSALRARRLSSPAAQLRAGQRQLTRCHPARWPPNARPALLVIDSIQSMHLAASRVQCRLAAAAARMHRSAGALRQDQRLRGHHRRPRHQGRQHRGTEAARAPGRYGAVFRERCRQPLSHAARDQEPLRSGQRAGLLRHERERTERGAQPVGDLPVAPPTAGARQRRHGGARRRPPAADRSAGAGGPQRASARRAAWRRAWTPTGCRCCWRS